ncbi:MAG: hypothetical protein GY727_11160, partial [Gammaproteobacteria bacterium]|nr:hypothetical protein [Gammaproteobacteria bacterium]
KPNTDPKQPANQFPITDGVGGAPVSNPYTVTDGQARNANGELIIPVIEQQEYSMRFESPAGGQFWEVPRFIGDGLSSGGGGTGGIPDLTLNNLDLAKGTDLSAYNFVFIKAESSGWEGTATGADVSSFYYRDGTTGTPSTGDNTLFYDSAGNGWQLSKSVQEQANESAIVALDQIILSERDSSAGASLNYTAPSDGTYEVYLMCRGIVQAAVSGEVSLDYSIDSGSPTGLLTGFQSNQGWGAGGVEPFSKNRVLSASSNEILKSEGAGGGAPLGYSGNAYLIMSEGDEITFTHTASGSAALLNTYTSIRKSN